MGNLLYNDNRICVKKEIGNMKNPMFLHIFANYYNWDDGFEIPWNIVQNENCDLGTALKMFYDAEGEIYLKTGDDLENKEWTQFISFLYKQIIEDTFKYKCISYKPEFGKVHLYILRKKNPNIPDIFINKTPGMDVCIPII